MAKMITIIGPTACGKTAVATQLAVRVGGEVISADSRQVYRRMDIGTGKDLADYEVGGRHVPYHLIDIAEPGTKYNLFQYQHDFLKAYESILARGAQPILCGGTGLYVEAVLRGYRLAAVPENKEPPIDSLIVGLDIGREERRRRITERLRQRLDSGMVDEVRSLLESGVAADDLIYYGLEYKYVTEYAIGRIGYDEMFAQLEIAIHQFAKRQMTWFRGMERRGLHIHWIDAMRPVAEKVDEIIRMM